MNGSVTGGIPVSAKRRGYALTAGVLLVMMLGGTLPVPLYVLWEKQMGFGPLGVTVVFVAYVVGTLAALLVLGDLSDHVGRRIVLALAALTGIPETVRSPDRAVSLRPRIAVPPGMRTVMLGACLGVFAAFSVLGLFSSVVPTFLHGILGVHNLALVGGASFLIFVIAAISQAVSAGLPSRRSVGAGLPLLLVCLATLESALFAKALWLFLVATVVGGVAVGFIFRGGLSELNRLADPGHRAAVVATFFVAAYLGL